MGFLRSPLFIAAVGLTFLALCAPGRAHAGTLQEDDDDNGRDESQDDTSRTSADDTPDEPKDAGPPHTDVSDPPPSHRPTRWQRLRLEGAIGIRFGSFTLNGDSSGTAIPFHLDLGLRRDRWLVYASYDVLGVTSHVPAATPGDDATTRSATAPSLGDGSGLAHRLGANARYALGRLGETDGGWEMWAEGGIGVQHMRWDAGGTWTRPDISLGIGGTLMWLGTERHGGFSLGLRIMLAPRNDTSNAPPVCGGPCDTATGPASYDRSFLFDMSVPFGT